MQHNSIQKSKAQCCSRAERKKRGRTETEDVAQIPPNPTAKQLQTPSHSLLTEAQSQSTTQHFRWGIPFLHNCAHTPNPATPELPPKDTLSSQSVQTLTSTTAKKENKYFPFFQKLKNVGRRISTAIWLITRRDASRIPDFLASVLTWYFCFFWYFNHHWPTLPLYLSPASNFPTTFIYEVIYFTSCSLSCRVKL